MGEVEFLAFVGKRYEVASWFALVVCLSFVGQSFAATLQPMGGEVYINRGRGYDLVTQPIPVNPGDLVMVNPNGRATVVYSDACSVNVAPGPVTTITPNPPCGGPLSPDVAQSYAQAPPSSSGGDTGLYLGAAGVALGAAGLGVGLYALSQHNSNTTVNGMTCGTIGNPCWESISP